MYCTLPCWSCEDIQQECASRILEIQHEADNIPDSAEVVNGAPNYAEATALACYACAEEGLGQEEGGPGALSRAAERCASEHRLAGCRVPGRSHRWSGR